METEEAQKWQEKLGLTYHVSYALEGERRVGLREKDVLEIGGRLPEKFVFDGLGVRSWVATEAPDYMQNLGSESLSAQIGSVDLIQDEKISKAPQDFKTAQNDYFFFHYAAEELPESFNESFDVIFSIACFEHIHDLGRSLDAMYAALRPGGKVFSMFSPIWPSANGHHIAPVTDNEGRTFTFNNSPIPPWGHLLMRPPEMYNFLLKHTDKKAAAELVHNIYHNPTINRYFNEDYFKYFNASKFKVEEGLLTFPANIDDSVQKELQRLYPHSQYFNNCGILAVLTKEI